MERSKKFAFGFLGFMAALLFILFIGGLIAKKQIGNALEESLGEQADWEELDVKVFRRRIVLDKVDLRMGNSRIRAEKLLLKDLNYFRYIFNNEIHVGELELHDPEIVIRQKEEESAEDATESEFEQEITVATVKVINGSVRFAGEDGERDESSFLLEQLVINEVEVDSASLKQRPPFRYASYESRLKSIEMQLDGQHDLLVENLTAAGEDLQLEGIEIIPRYDKVEFQKHIPHEKDRFELEVSTIHLENFDWRFENDSLLFSATSFTIASADLEVYRNKLMPKDTRKKELYSEKLRNLPVKLDFPRVQVTETRITYEEKTTQGRPPGKVFFTDVDVTIENLSNVGMEREDFPVTKIHAEALFHGEAPVELDWEFDVSNTREEFKISGMITAIPAEAMNAFIRPALNVEARGGIDSFAYNFAGDDDSAIGDVRTKYEDFKINILKDDGTEKSSFWSSLANLFLTNDAVTDNVNHRDLTVTRDKTKSFWNYLWLCVREGALSSFL